MRESERYREGETSAEYMHLDRKNNKYITTNRGLPLIGYITSVPQLYHENIEAIELKYISNILIGKVTRVLNDSI